MAQFSGRGWATVDSRKLGVEGLAEFARCNAGSGIAMLLNELSREISELSKVFMTRNGSTGVVEVAAVGRRNKIKNG